MINYYVRPDGAHVKVNTETKEVTLALSIPVQKTLSYINNPEYYDRMVLDLDKWPVSDEAAFTAAFNAIKVVLLGE